MKIMFVSLGCAKNLVDSEVMLKKLYNNGHTVCDNYDDADITVINTCGFIEDAKKEAIENIFEAITAKKEGRIKGIVVAGCLAERYKEEIVKEMPEVDSFIGIGSYDKVLEAVNSAVAGERYTDFAAKSNAPIGGDRLQTTPFYTSYLKISDGCNNCCSYCAIPLIRGAFRSKPIEELVDEAKRLAKNGVMELCVVSQETTRYGEDLYGESKISELLEELCKIEGIKWIRPLYLYPDKITDKLLDTIENNDKILKYFDMPMQHINDGVLKSMNRTGNRETTLKIIKKIRDRFPESIIRTTFIVGFPTEGEKEFTDLVNFVRESGLDRIGVFTYSVEEGTPSEKLKDLNSPEVKASRRDTIMYEQSLLIDKKNNLKIGKTEQVLVEGYDKYAECFFGRTKYDAPDVDGKVYFTSQDKKPGEGSLVDVKINSVIDYDLYGETI